MNVVLVSHRARERRGPSLGYDFPRAKVFLIRFCWNTTRDEAREGEPGQRGASKLGGKMKKVWRSMTFQKPKSDQKSKSVRNFNDRDVPYDPRLLQRAATAEELANRNPMMHEQQSTLVAA